MDSFSWVTVPNFEPAGDHGKDNTYNVTVVATDKSNKKSELPVAVRLRNVEERGTLEIIFSNVDAFVLQPEVGRSIKAQVFDDDGVDTSTYKWEWRIGSRYR